MSEAPEYAWERLRGLIADHLGLDFPSDRRQNLENAVRKASSANGFQDVAHFMKWLLETPYSETRIETLITFLTVGETHFYRDEKLFVVLARNILPELIKDRAATSRRIRIWSAGCATGEEPYTIAMVVKDILGDTAGWNIHILATDLNRVSLKKAEQGVYTQWSFRSTPQDLKDAHFVKDGDSFLISDEVKRMVKLAPLNLAKDAYPSFSNETDHMDIIFCRNVIMYFTAQRQQQTIDRFSRCLESKGRLIVSPAEASLVQHARFAGENVPGVVIFRKDCGPAARTFDPGLFPDTRSVEPETGGEKAPYQGDNPFLAVFEQAALIDRHPRGEIETPAPEPLRIERKTSSPPKKDIDSDTWLEQYNEGLRLFEEGSYSEAADKLLALTTEKRSSKDSARIMSVLTKAYANLGSLEKALHWSEHTVASDKLNPDYHYLHGAILQEMGFIEEAVASMVRAVFLKPDFAVVHFSLGNIARRRGRLKESQRHYKAALRILGNYGDDDTVPASEGMTAGRLMEIILSMTRKEVVNGKAQ